MKEADYLERQLTLFTDCGNGQENQDFSYGKTSPEPLAQMGGADFRAVLEEIGQTEIPMPERNKWAQSGVVQCDQCEIAWRVLDAQYWGVPQRRKRIFLVADFGGFGAGEILFERTGLHGDSTESQEAREKTTGNAGAGTDSTSGNIAFREGSFGSFIADNIAGTAKASGGVLGGGSETLIKE